MNLRHLTPPNLLSNMNRPIRLLSLLALLALVASPSADAQRRPVRRGEVSGVEASIEGPLDVARGGTLRWLVSAYEVVGLDELRPAGLAMLTLTSALPESEPLEVRANEFGQAMLELPVPEDAPDRFGATLTVRAPRGVSRRFDVMVQVGSGATIELYAPPRVQVGTDLPIGGRLATSAGGGKAGQRVELTLLDGRGPSVSW